MRILITGGCGHIGSHLIRSISHDYQITVVDNLLTGRYSSLFDIGRDIRFIEDDFVNINGELLSEIDVVIHLAAITDAAGSFGNKEQIELVNIDKTKEFIDKCVESKVKEFIFPSSTSVYGVSTDTVYEDNDDYLNPQSPYAESKVVIENYLTNSGLNYHILRFGTIYGYSIGMRFHTAINKFCLQKALDIPLTIWRENYNQVRPYLGLDDATQAIDMVLSGHIKNGVYNILSENLMLSDVVSVIGDVDIQFVDTPLLNQFTYNVSFDKIAKCGFKPKNTIKDEIPLILHKLRYING